MFVQTIDVLLGLHCGVFSWAPFLSAAMHITVRTVSWLCQCWSWLGDSQGHGQLVIAPLREGLNRQGIPYFLWPVRRLWSGYISPWWWIAEFKEVSAGWTCFEDVCANVHLPKLMTILQHWKGPTITTGYRQFGKVKNCWGTNSNKKNKTMTLNDAGYGVKYLFIQRKTCGLISPQEAF